LELALTRFYTDPEGTRYGISRSLNLIRDVKKYITRKSEVKQDEID
jgi:hypothetical protein